MMGPGLLLRNLLPDTALATYAYILLSYHLILAFKVLMSDKKAALALPIGSAILTHLACVGLLIGLAMGRHEIPLFGIIRFFIPGLAPFEARWLFSGEKKIVIAESSADVHAANGIASTANAGAIDAPAAPSLYHTSTGEDYDEFLKLMQAGKRPFRKPGRSIRDEYELWLAAKARASAPSASKSQTA
ncbi:MAG: hypothetical protein ABSF53_07105 [Terracidiphilus sp.]|jgi:hypothetical protein